MQFRVIQDAIDSINNTIQDTAIAAIRTLKSNTFDAKIRNFPKTQKIKGTVTVANQKNVEKELREGKKLHKAVIAAIKAIKIPSKVEVANFPKPDKHPGFPKSFEISNFPKPIEFPKNIRVSNQPTSELKMLNAKVDKLTGEIKKIKLNPKINVEAPKSEKVVVPPANVSVTQKEIDYKKLAKAMPKPAKDIDYKKLSEMIASEVASMAVTVGGGGGGGSRKEGLDDLTRSYNICDKDVASTTKYYGFTGRLGNWYILRENTTTNEYRYIKGASDYTTNWTGRAGLSYDYYHEIF